MWISYLHQNFLLSITWYWFINFRDAVCVVEKSKMKTPLISVSPKTHSLEMTPCYMFIWWMGLVIPSCFFSKDLNPVHEDRDRLEHHVILWKYQYPNQSQHKLSGSTYESVVRMNTLQNTCSKVTTKYSTKEATTESLYIYTLIPFM